MALIPAICESCGTIWGAENFIGGSGAHIQMTGTRVGPCPQCGGWGAVPDGVYDLHDDMLKVVKAANVPAENLQELVGLLESLRRGEVSENQVIEQAEANAPDLAPLIKQVLAKTDPSTWLGILLALIGLYLQVQAPKAPTADEIASELRSDNTPGLVMPPTAQNQPRSAGRAKSAQRRRPPKTHGKVKHRKSRKRR